MMHFLRANDTRFMKVYGAVEPQKADCCICTKLYKFALEARLKLDYIAFYVRFNGFKCAQILFCKAEKRGERGARSHHCAALPQMTSVSQTHVYGGIGLVKVCKGLLAAKESR